MPSGACAGATHRGIDSRDSIADNGSEWRLLGVSSVGTARAVLEQSQSRALGRVRPYSNGETAAICAIRMEETKCRDGELRAADASFGSQWRLMGVIPIGRARAVFEQP